MMLGQLIAQVGQLNTQMPKFSEQLAKQTELLTNQQIDINEYWTGLRKANEDIQTMRDSVVGIHEKIDKSVPVERFEKLEEHVHTLNGTDNKFRSLGINLDDADEWRDVFSSVKKSHQNNSAIKLRVLQALAVAIAMAVGAATWDGLTADINQEVTHNESSTSNRAQDN